MSDFEEKFCKDCNNSGIEEDYMVCRLAISCVDGSHIRCEEARFERRRWFLVGETGCGLLGDRWEEISKDAE